jgi:hypothetical protein
MAGSISGQTTSLTNLSIGALNSNNTTTGVLDLRTFMAKLSMQTFGSASGMTTGEVRLVYQASGVTLLWSSGATQYTIAGSAVSLAQS